MELQERPTKSRPGALKRGSGLKNGIDTRTNFRLPLPTAGLPLKDISLRKKGLAIQICIGRNGMKDAIPANYLPGSSQIWISGAGSLLKTKKKMSYDALNRDF